MQRLNMACVLIKEKTEMGRLPREVTDIQCGWSKALELCFYKPMNSKVCWPSQQMGESASELWASISPDGSLLSSSSDWERINFCCFKPPTLLVLYRGAPGR